ncbi:MAG: hypothetical protein NUW06_00310 [Candidatus Acetothermia bacterium]|jgi:outer membrane lipoprotein-sorting protein|nr:hypothetical protein [Candidatus Acetothermia bacterium]MDH7504956.1 hypothetical protein [Candidatus Acetothermia bacterium]
MVRRGLVALAVVLFSAWGALAQPPEFQAFLQRLKEAYVDLQDLQATVTIVKLTPQGKEKLESRVRIGTLVKQKVLRLEFLEPADLRGQVFTLDGYLLSQYLPVNNLIVIQEITAQHPLYPLLEFLNFDLEGIVARLQEERFALGISQQLTSASLMTELDLQNTVAALARGQAVEPTAIGLSLERVHYGMEDFPFSLTVSSWKMGDYLLEASSQQEGLLSQEFIWIDPLDLIPRRVEIHLVRQLEGKVKEEVTTYLVNEIQLNRGVTEGALLALPKDAKIIRASAK